MSGEVNKKGGEGQRDSNRKKSRKKEEAEIFFGDRKKSSQKNPKYSDSRDKKIKDFETSKYTLYKTSISFRKKREN